MMIPSCYSIQLDSFMSIPKNPILSKMTNDTLCFLFYTKEQENICPATFLVKQSGWNCNGLNESIRTMWKAG